MGTPQYETFRTLLVRLHPDLFKELLKKWFGGSSDNLKKQILHVDGKRLKTASKKAEVVHLVELFCSNNRLMITQEKVPDKHGEPTAFAKVIECIDLQNSILTCDALYTNPDIASQIINKNGDYILALKQNQKNLCDESENHFMQAAEIDFEGLNCDIFETLEKSHGRIEKRTIRVAYDLKWLPQLKRWPKLNCLIEVVSQRSIGDVIQQETRQYISSAQGTAQEFSTWIRSHWSIENQLHWVADVVFREDLATNYVGYSAENLALFRRLVMNAICYLMPEKSISSFRKVCAFDSDYLKGFLYKFFSK